MFFWCVFCVFFGGGGGGGEDWPDHFSKWSAAASDNAQCMFSPRRLPELPM